MDDNKYKIIIGNKMKPRRTAPDIVFSNYEEAEEYGMKSFSYKYFNVKGGWRVQKTFEKKIYPLYIGDLLKCSEVKK